MSILWCGLCRNNVLLAETGLHDDGPADKLKKSILKKKPTAGWEFAEAFPRTSHHAVKLHVYEARDLVWSATCIYEGDASSLAKGFLEKIILMTEPLRPELKDGGELSAQQMLSPMLDQRMTAANSQGRVAMISDRVAEVKGIMNDNINVMLENHARIDHLEGQSQQLLQGASQFKKATNKLKRFYLMQNAKFGAAAGTAVGADLGVNEPVDRPYARGSTPPPGDAPAPKAFSQGAATASAHHVDRQRAGRRFHR